MLNDILGAGSAIEENRVLEVETRSVSMVHSETLNTCSDKGGDNVVAGVGVVVEEDRVLFKLSPGMLNVTVSTSSLLRSPRLRLGMVKVLHK